MRNLCKRYNTALPVRAGLVYDNFDFFNRCRTSGNKHDDPYFIRVGFAAIKNAI